MNAGKWRVHYAWVVLAVGTSVVFASLGLARFGYTAVLPEMQAGLDMDNTRAGALASANLVGYLTLALLGGALAARFGPRVVITAGLTLAGVAMFFTGAAQGFGAAAFWRALTGVGSGASNVPVMAMLSAWFARRRRGLAAGIGVAGSSVALIVVGAVAPRILAAFGEDGWRMVWRLFGGTTLFLAVVAAVVLRDHPETLGLRPLGDTGDDPVPPAGPAKLEWGQVYRSRVVWHIGAIYAAFGFSYIIYMTFFKKHLMIAGGYTQESAGRLFVVMGWFSLFCGLIWGSVSDRLGRRAALIMVYLVQATAFVLFALCPTRLGFGVSAVLFGLTAWSIPAIMAALCGDLLGPRLAPAALGFITLFFGIGQAMGPSVAGAMADRAGSFAPAFLLAAGIALVGAVGTALLHPGHLRR